MLINTLISAILNSREQAFRLCGKLSDLKYFQVFALLVVVQAMSSPFALYARNSAATLLTQAPVNSYIVKEIGNPIPLMSKEIDRPVSPASLTKIMTCILALESGKLDQDVLITKESTMVEPSKAGFRVGDKIKLIDLVKAAMVSSSNDAAFALAIHLSGTVDSFVASMNNKAKMIGMKNTLFTNPAGFDKGIYAGNISTAGDLMRLTEYSVKNPLFNQVARLEKVVVPEQTSKKVFWLKTHNKLLDRYPYAVGIKTGYTCKAGGCLIARAIKDNKDMLLVMLNARNRWDIASNMFDSAFAGTTSNPLLVSGVSRSQAVPSRVQRINETEKSQKRSDASADRSAQKKKLLPAEKKQLIAGLKSSRKLNRAMAADLKSARHTKKNALVGVKGIKALKKQVIAESKNHRLKKRQLVSSKPVKKSKKRVAVS
ncbi:MAG: D-alanyl-D-alanine carboxypeptidase [Chlorobium sp.]